MHEADPKDLISFLLETLHKELNKANNAPHQNIGYNLNEADSYDENKAIQILLMISLKIINLLYLILFLE